MVLDPDRAVYIKKEIRDRTTGNTYPADPARPYNLLTFSPNFRTEVYFTHECKTPANPLVNPALSAIAPSPLVPTLDVAPPLPVISEAPYSPPEVPSPVIEESPTIRPVSTSKK